MVIYCCMWYFSRSDRVCVFVCVCVYMCLSVKYSEFLEVRWDMNFFLAYSQVICYYNTHLFGVKKHNIFSLFIYKYPVVTGIFALFGTWIISMCLTCDILYIVLMWITLIHNRQSINTCRRILLWKTVTNCGPGSQNY